MPGYMTAHCRQLHGTEPVIDWGQLPVSQTEYLPMVYEVILKTHIKSF